MQYPPYIPPSAPPNPPVQQRMARKTGGRRKWFLLLGLVAAAALVVTVLMVRQSNAARDMAQAQQRLQAEVTAWDGLFLPNVYVDDIHLGGMTPQEGLDAVYQKQEALQNSWSLQLTYQGQLLGTLDYASLGIHASQEEAYMQVRNAFEIGKTGTLQERKAVMERLGTMPYTAYTTQTALNESLLDQLLTQLQAQFTYAPSDAYLAYFRPDLKDPFIIQPGINGATLDTAPLKSQILYCLENGRSGSIEVQPSYFAPSVTEADIRSQVTLLNKAVTPISKDSSNERTNNIRVAFGKINGVILEPGQTFSFNSTVGARTTENGFKYAIEYVNGEEEMGIGGGVCQASTTVYLAALQSGLQITKRTPHSDPVSYTTFGQDATVYYSRDRKIDFAFKNNTNSKIYITAYVEEYAKNKYQSVVCLYGLSLGNQVSYTLNTITVEKISAPLTPIERKDTNQTYVKYTDQRQQVRKARDGYINETYLQRWEGNRMVEEKLVSRDKCEARAAIIYVGTQSR